MTTGEIYQQLITRIMGTKWHFFKWHIQQNVRTGKVDLINSLVQSLALIEAAMPGAGVDYIEKIANICDREKETKHYDMLMQVLAEIIVVRQAATYPWKDLISIAYEPKAPGSKKNPEVVVYMKELTVGIEVKAPEMVKKHNERSTKPHQVTTRNPIAETLKREETMLPRDNPVKDFLISADGKFAGFKAANPNFYGVLVVVWDDFIYEPISAIMGNPSGLFMPGSFAQDANGQVLRFENVDLVIVTRHLLQVKRSTREEPQEYQAQHGLEYGRAGEFPYKVYFQNPNSTLPIPEEVLNCFQALKPGPELGAEYLPLDYVMWTGGEQTEEHEHNKGE